MFHVIEGFIEVGMVVKVQENGNEYRVKEILDYIPVNEKCAFPNTCGDDGSVNDVLHVGTVELSPYSRTASVWSGNPEKAQAKWCPVCKRLHS